MVEATNQHPAVGPLRQVDAGLLNAGYAEAGPGDGRAAVLLHGWPYDIHSYLEVVPLLAAAGPGWSSPTFAASGRPASCPMPPSATARRPRSPLTSSRCWMLWRSSDPQLPLAAGSGRRRASLCGPRAAARPGSGHRRADHHPGRRRQRRPPSEPKLLCPEVLRYLFAPGHSRRHRPQPSPGSPEAIANTVSEVDAS
jgi:hypothetical protein